MPATSSSERLESALQFEHRHGVRTHPNGTLEIGIAAGISTVAPIHIVFPAAPAEAMSDASAFLATRCKSVKSHAAASYLRFIDRHNGLYMFCGHLSIYGRRIGLLSRGFTPSPFDIIAENTNRDFMPHQIAIGSTLCNTHTILMDCEANHFAVKSTHTPEQLISADLDEVVLRLIEEIGPMHDWGKYIPPWRLP